MALIYTLKADGTIYADTPQKVYQGSNNANTISIVSTEIARNNQLTIAFKLPHYNIYSEPYLMTLSENDYTESNVNVWNFNIPVAVTQYAGNAEFQVSVHSGAFVAGVRVKSTAPTTSSSGNIGDLWYNTTTGKAYILSSYEVSGVVETYTWTETNTSNLYETATSGSGTFIIEQGIAPTLPQTPTPSIYSSILNKLTEIKNIGNFAEYEVNDEETPASQLPTFYIYGKPSGLYHFNRDFGLESNESAGAWSGEIKSGGYVVINSSTNYSEYIVYGKDLNNKQYYRFGVVQFGNDTDMSNYALLDNANGTTLFAPTTAGTSGQYLKSNGAGQLPTWETADATPTQNSTKAVQSGGVYSGLATLTEAINTINTTLATKSNITETGNKVQLHMDSSNYTIYATLSDKNNNVISTSSVIDLPLESVVVSGSYDATTKKIKLVLQNGNIIEFSVADLVSGLQTEITAQNKLSADLVDDTNTANKFVTAEGYVKNASATSNLLTLTKSDGTTVTFAGGGGGTGDYTQLTNKPSINGETLTGNKTGIDLGLVQQYDTMPAPSTITSDSIVEYVGTSAVPSNQWVAPTISFNNVRLSAVWQVGGRTFCDWSSAGVQTHLEFVNGEWVTHNWTLPNYFDSNDMYVINDVITMVTANKYYTLGTDDVWTEHNISGELPTGFETPLHSWTDGTNIYGIDDLAENGVKLDTENMAWTTTGAIQVPVAYDRIWNFDGHTYSSAGNSQHELVNGEWVEKTWAGLTNFDKANIWQYNDEAYYSTYSQGTSLQYKLDQTTSTWNIIGWALPADMVSANKHLNGQYIKIIDGVAYGEYTVSSTTYTIQLDTLAFTNGYFYQTNGSAWAQKNVQPNSSGGTTVYTNNIAQSRLDFTSDPQTQITSANNQITTINGLIPQQATAQNQLADKNFVNSSIATNTANFKGTYNIVSDLGLARDATHAQVEAKLLTEVSSPTNNDYVFVAIPNATETTHIDQFDRYKYNSSISAWAYEFTLNNSSFTAEQWSAINSGITSTLAGKITTNETAITTLLNSNRILDGTRMSADTTQIKGKNNSGYTTFMLENFPNGMITFQEGTSDTTTATSSMVSLSKNGLFSRWFYDGFYFDYSQAQRYNKWRYKMGDHYVYGFGQVMSAQGTMPTGKNGLTVLYTGTTDTNYTQNHIYQYQTNAWVDITPVVPTTITILGDDD